MAGTTPRKTQGVFAGIDERGQVLLAQPDGSICGVPEHHIQRLVEME
jgi:biotin-(acetyl-CoA carboxylase) ligase